MQWLTLLSYVCVVTAQLNVPAEQGDQFSLGEPHKANAPPRIAIIGAGAGGSFAAYWLSFLARHNASLTTHIDLFDKEDRIGGRCTTVRIPGYDDQQPLELGASIFVEVNKNLWKAAHVFNLSLQDGHGGGHLESGMTVWDGETFVWEQSEGSSWYWNAAKLLWTYGRAPLQVRSIIKTTVESFLSVYDHKVQGDGPFRSVPAFARSIGLSRLYAQSVEAYLANQSVHQKFIDDIVGAAVRVNYGQSPARIHGVDGLVSMAADGASSVRGGNRQIFGRFVAESDARVKLLTPVDTLVRLDDSTRWLIPDHGVYDAVILATPYHLSGIHVAGASINVPSQDYVRLHVTLLVTSTPFPRADFFVRGRNGQDGPRTVLSTFAMADRGETQRPRINSVNYLRQVSKNEWAVKIFSEHEVNQALLDDLFGSHTVNWIHRHVWYAYPRATPMTDRDFAHFELAPRLYYANAFEALVSTMETSTVGGANAANLALYDLFGFKSERTWAEWHCRSQD